MTANAQTTAHALALRYDDFKMPGIMSRRFTQQELRGWITPLCDGTGIFAEELGQSAEGRPITLYTCGRGPTRVLVWSQMHGDESTATMAIADILRFFVECPNDPLAVALREKLTLLLVPMLNPDGAERFTRRTAQHIDMNRDALALATPEARILRSLQQREHPAYGLNLHDQDIHYTVGASRRQTAIALLAPPVDDSRRDDVVRTRAKKLAAVLLHAFDEFIPGHVARWDDTFEPRAFGDNIQRWGTSTVLIESGGWANDPEKMTLRKWNCVSILTALERIANGTLEEEDASAYEALPFNTKQLLDVIIRGASLRSSAGVAAVAVDVGIMFEETRGPGGVARHMAHVVEIGDLSVFAALEERRADGRMLNAERARIDEVFSATEIEQIFGN